MNWNRSQAHSGTRVEAALLDSSLGTLGVWVSDTGVLRVSLPEEPGLEKETDTGGSEGILGQALEELDLYCRGQLKQFTVPLDLRGTSFQLEVWHQLLDIPYGETAPYGEIARLVGNPGASRAVGQAVGANPVPLIVPCHRVVAAGGKLGGFGGGLPLKRRLLAMEGVVV